MQFAVVGNSGNLNVIVIAREKAAKTKHKQKQTNVMQIKQ